MLRTRYLAFLAAVTMILGASFGTAPITGKVFAATPPLSNTLQGCSNPKAIAPPYNPGTFVCPDADYVNSVLKGWSDGDIVPFRLFMQAGNSAPTTPTQYQMSVAVDNLTFGNPNYSNGVVGYQFLSQPTLNTAPADGSMKKPRVVTNASCTYTVTPTATASPPVSKQLPADPYPVNGSASQSLYWTITVTMSRGQNCVFDLYAQLSMQADQVAPGRCDAKLHADLADATLNLQRTGAKEVPIQICDIHPLTFQQPDHSLSLQQNVNYVWTVQNGITPDHINFSNTCDTSQSGSQGVAVNVQWTRTAQPGVISITPYVAVHNPTQRQLYVTVNDVVQNGAGGSATVFQTLTFSGYVQPNSVTPVITAPFTEPAGTDVSQLNQQITVTYANSSATPVLATLTASDSATLVPAQSNDTATIVNTETMTETDPGNTLQFSVDSYQVYDANNNPVGAQNSGGSFSNGYTLGTPTKGSVVWTLTGVSDSGSVTFNKSVSLDTSNSALPQLPVGDLSDQTSLTPYTNGTAGSTISATNTMPITSGEKVTLTITKAIGNFSMGAFGSSDQPQTFTFDVQDPDGNDILVPDGNGNMVMPSITISSGNDGSVSIPGLDPGVQYTVTELPTAGWDTPPASQNVTISVTSGSPGSCGGTASVTNTIHANVTVQKVTYPVGHEAGWTFNLIGPGGSTLSSVTTTGASAIAFPVNLTQEGRYTVQEVGQSGWVNTVVSSASFTVDFPASGGQTFAAVFTNTQCVKPTVTAGNSNGVATFSITDANTPSTGTGLIGGSLPALSPLALGKQVNSTGSNGVGIKVVKLTNATMPAASWSDGAGSLTLGASKVNSSTGASIGLVATSLGGTPATVNVSSTGTVTVTNAGTCSTVFDPLLTSTIRQAGQPQTDTYSGIAQSESQLTIYDGTPGVSTMKLQVNGHSFTVPALQDGQKVGLDISSALGSGDNTITVTSVGKPGGSAVLLVAPPAG